MKRLISLTVILFLAGAAQAKTICSLESGDPKQDMVFANVLFSGEVIAPKYLLVNKAASAATEVQMSQFTTYEQWKAINGQTLVTFSPQQNGGYGITVGEIDLGKTNALPLVALVIGAVTEANPLSLIVPAKNLSGICVNLK